MTPLIRLGEVVQFRGGGTPSKQNAAYWGGEIPWVSPKDMKFARVETSIDKITAEAVDETTVSLIPKGAVLIVVRSGILARTIPLGITARELTVNQDIKALCPSTKVDSEFLYYFLRAAEPDILSLVSRGATVHRLLTDSLKDIRMPLPPLAEQKRIVAILDAAFAAIDTATAHAQRNLANARALFDGYFASVFNDSTVKYERLTLAELLDRAWIVDHMDGNHGGDYPRKHEFIGKGIPYISANCVVDEKVDMTRAKYLSAERARQLRKGFAKSGDVLFAHNATVGPVAILDTDVDEVILGTSLTYYRCSVDHILPEYLAHYMRSREFVRQYDQVMRQSTRNQVPITKQRTFYHMIPPIEVQRRMSAILDRLADRMIELAAVYTRKLALFAELRQSILRKAVAGELTSKELASVA